MKYVNLSVVLFTFIFITAGQAFAYKCKTTPAGVPTVVNNYCGTISTQGIFSDGSSIYGTNKKITAQLKQFWDGKTRVCVDACAVENDLQVFNIISPRITKQRCSTQVTQR